ncbi:hypothetical protein RIU96_07540 [Corynebacterium sp. Z-1]|uniref:hypothetical protein n=1 Tax=Corynebacterium sp. Z-1 TaxID=3074378 RepID=UPI0028830918|nr:hypothetical protein [Corynebacterium sp. Z-1]WNI12090.1 hypothetical protein RIU96_07540 [Corynebacterium sp. Z-1]
MSSNHNRNQAPTPRPEQKATISSDRTMDEILPDWDVTRPTEIVVIQDSCETVAGSTSEIEVTATSQQHEKEKALLREWEEWQDVISPEHLEAAGQIFAREPNAFLTFLARYYFEELPDDLEQDFDSVYVGSYDTPEDWAAESFQILGWSEALEQVQHAAAIPEGILHLDTDAFLDWAQNSMGFEISAGRDQVHIFHP